MKGENPSVGYVCVIGRAGKDLAVRDGMERLSGSSVEGKDEEIGDTLEEGSSLRESAELLK